MDDRRPSLIVTGKTTMLLAVDTQETNTTESFFRLVEKRPQALSEFQEEGGKDEISQIDKSIPDTVDVGVRNM